MQNDKPQTTYLYLNDIVSDLANEICRSPSAMESHDTKEKNIKELLIRLADEVRRSAIEP